MNLNNMTCKASLRCLDVSHYKLNDIAKMIVGMSVAQADVQLLFCNRRGSLALRKLLASCAANAEHNHGLNVNSLVIHSVDVGKAMMLRRSMPRGRGRMSKIEKRYSNVTLMLRDGGGATLSAGLANGKQETKKSDSK